MALDKSVTDVDGGGPSGVVDEAGDVISYQIVVTNDGNVDLLGVSVADPLLEGTNGTLSAAAESVVKNGLPVPAAKTTTRPFSRCRMALRRM